MSRPTIAVYAFAAALMAVSIVFGGVAAVALPVAFLALGVGGFIDYKHLRKQVASTHDRNEQARTDEVDVTERDRQALIGE